MLFEELCAEGNSHVCTRKLCACGTVKHTIHRKYHGIAGDSSCQGWYIALEKAGSSFVFHYVLCRLAHIAESAMSGVTGLSSDPGKQAKCSEKAPDNGEGNVGGVALTCS